MTREETWDLAARRRIGATGDWLQSDLKPPQAGCSDISGAETGDGADRGHLIVDDIGSFTDHHELFRNVSFEAMPGTTTFIVGAADDVQAALLGALLGTEQPETGTVTVDGEVLSALPLAVMRSTTAIALQDPWLTAGSIADNIIFGLTGVEPCEVLAAAELACVMEFTDGFELGLNTEISEQGLELTVGQRRRIALARAVIRRPAILLIEEPTTQLSAAEELLAIKAIGQVSKGTTTVLTTDRLSLADVGDQIIRFDGGRSETTSSHRAVAPMMLHTAWGANPTAAGWEPRHTPGDPGPAEALTDIDVGHQLTPRLASTTLIERAELTETWLAWAIDRDHLVQVKVPRLAPATPAARRELAREYQRVVSLRHPGLARPIEAGLHGESPYAVYEHVDGPTLATILGSHVHLPEPANVMRMGYELARTLSSLHAEGLVHLDLRAQIVALSPQGTILTDLSMARPNGYKGQSVYRSGQVGTIAPEQLKGGLASPSMDMFALGVVMYQAATGTLSSNYHGTLRDRNQILGPRPPERRPAPTHLGNRYTMTWPKVGALGGTDTRHETTTTWTLGGDLALAIRSVVGRLTAANPDDRPTAAQAMTLMRPFLHPAE
ncbi:MAG: ATP-binding cassette domain-containing protein [Actinomycetia bacterium]|nr:ATP-binding cassette domain-containing protein [Actinomycetes bacterium]